ncbi:MAG: hypothetical protein H7333_06565 [Bdellovibrionales bacterium]|nr:hypothetical protein [Oligoflexia bacterium]
MSSWGFRQKSDAHSYLRSESGQSIILISMVILSFLMFFSFAINTGLLINAKISVQAAADAAAYAGAATQARQLNAISYLNYDMRRQYKKFLFRYVFVGSMGSPGFPNNADPADTSPQYDFPKLDYKSGNPKLVGIKVPVVCIPLTTAGKSNDNCLNVNLPDTSDAIRTSIGTGGLNAITRSLLDNINSIQNLQNRLCQSQGEMNLFVLLTWLFRGDLSTAQLTALLTELQKANAAQTGIPVSNQELQAATEAIQGLVKGLGLYPRNIINLMRIETLRDFLNEPKDSEITLDKAQAWEKAPNAEAKERSLQAFHSALANLNSDVFDANLLKVSELQADHQITLNRVLIDFNAYVQLMSNPRNGPPPATGVICSSFIAPFPAKSAPVGVTVDQSASKVNYAVRVRAFIKPRGLLFLPGSEPLELDAVAGAKPFGSRIGPRVLNQASLTKEIPPFPVNGPINDCSGVLGCAVPDIDIGPNGLTSYTRAYLNDLRAKAMQGGTAFTSAGIQNAQKHASAPNPQEVGHYNILPPPKAKDRMAYEFIQYSNDVNSSVYRFYAPIFPNMKGDPSATVKKFMNDLFPQTSVSNDNPFNIDLVQMRYQIEEAINLYISSSLSTGRETENGETLTFAALDLPMSGLTPSQGYWLTDAAQVLSSWGPKFSHLENGYGFQARFGYSVKFVTMQNLLTEGITDDDGDLSKIHH